MNIILSQIGEQRREIDLKTIYFLLKNLIDFYFFETAI